MTNELKGGSMKVDPVFARNPHYAERLGGKHVLVLGAGSGGSAIEKRANG